MKKVLGILLCAALWTALLVPFFLGAPAAHPATDDFTFAAYTHPTWVKTGSILHVLKDALSYALRTWRDWQGTVTGVIIMTLNPAVFSLEHYGVHAAVLLALHLVSWLTFIGHVFGRRLVLSKAVWIPLYFALSAMSLVFLPDIVEGIYWFNGAWFYTGAQAAALITLVLADRLCESRTGKKRLIAWAVLCCLLLFALGMDNYITAMMTLAALGMMMLQRLWAALKTPKAALIGVSVWSGEEPQTAERAFGGAEEKKLQLQAALRAFLLMLPIGAGLLLSVVAPGNSVRMATDGAHQAGTAWLVSSILWTMRDAAGYFVRFLTKTPLLALMIGLTPVLAKAVDKKEEKAWRCPPVLFTVVGTYALLCAMIIPHMYSSGYAGSGRVVNMYHLYVLLAVPAAYVMILMRLRVKTRAGLWCTESKRTCALLSLCALALCLALGQHGNYAKLVCDQRNGTQDAYIAQFKNEYALCVAAEEADDVLLPAWTVQTMTGKPTAYTDETVWTNESMAHYFGVRSVKVSE